MKILISGGSGIIGAILVDQLVQNGHQVWVLTRTPQTKQQKAGISWVGWDGRTPQGWGHLAGAVDAIINLAGASIGEKRWSDERKRIIRASRVNAGKAIVAAVEQHEPRPKVLLQIAGVGYYGPHGDEPLDEESLPGTDFLASVAVDWENATKPVEQLGVRRVIMRTGVVLSPKGGVLAPFLLQHRLFAGGPLGSGEQWISWIHIRDLVNSILFFLNTEGAQGIFNVTSPEPVTNAQFGITLGRVMNRPYWIPAPAFMLRLVLGEMSTLVLDGQRVMPKRLMDMGFQFQFGHLRNALEDLVK